MGSVVRVRGGVGEPRCRLGLEERALAVEDVCVGVNDLAVDAERHAVVRHRLQRGGHFGEVRHAARRVGRGPRRVELERLHVAALGGALDLLWRGGVGEVHGHHRLEAASGRPARVERVEDPLLVFLRILNFKLPFMFWCYRCGIFY